jgi:hypothetical protein
MTTRDEIRQQLADALAQFHPRFIDADDDLVDALLPVVGAVAAVAYRQGRDDEATDVLSDRESAASRWWEP